MTNGIKKRQFARDVIGTFLTKVVLIVLKTSLGIVTARILGPAGRGLFYTSAQCAGLANTVGTFSVGEALIYYIGEGRLERRRMFGSILGMVFAFTAILWTILYLVLPWLQETVLRNYDENLIVFVFALMPGMMLEYFSSSALRGLRVFRVANTMTIVTRTILLVFVAGALLIVSADVYIGVAAFTVGIWVSALIYVVVLYLQGDRNRGVDWRRYGSILKYGGATHIGTLLTEVEYRLDAFILLYFLNAAAVGIYSIGVTISQMLWYVSNSINTVLFPHLAASKDEDRNIVAAKMLKHSLYANGMVALGLVVAAYPLIRVLYGSAFTEAYGVFLVLAPGLLSDSVGRSLAVWLKGRGKPLMMSWSSAASLVLNVGLNFAFIPSYGIYGAALASSISYSFRAAILLVLFYRHTRISLKTMFLFEADELKEAVKVIRAALARRRGCYSS